MSFHYSSNPLPAKNLLINGDFAINQRAPATNADDTYAHDRWNVLTQSNAIAVSTLSDVEDGLRKMARLTQSNASAQRMGYAQIIEGANCKHLRGQTVTFRFRRYRCSASQPIRFAVLQWTSTEDSVTSDVVSDWTSSTYTASNFFIANITASVTSATPSAATLTDGPGITVALGSAFNNLIVMAWTQGTAAQNVTLDLGEAQIEVGSVATPFERHGFDVELRRCQRYYAKTFPIGTTPAQAAGAPGALIMASANTTAYNAVAIWQYPVAPMRAAPTITTYNPRQSNANFRDFANTADLVVDMYRAASDRQASAGSATAPSAASAYEIHMTADAEL